QIHFACAATRSRTENNDSRRLMDYRIEKDSMGEVRVPKSALYGAQTQRAVENFPISGYTFPRTFIRALGLIKAAAARVNLDLGLLDAKKADDVVKTGRTHLMDAMPVRLGQEIGGWAAQIELAMERVQASLPRLHELAIGGTAVGMGINAHPEFGRRVARRLAETTEIPFVEARDHFAAQSAMDAAVEMSG